MCCISFNCFSYEHQTINQEMEQDKINKLVSQIASRAWFGEQCCVFACPPICCASTSLLSRVILFSSNCAYPCCASILYGLCLGILVSAMKKFDANDIGSYLGVASSCPEVYYSGGGKEQLEAGLQLYRTHPYQECSLGDIYFSNFDLGKKYLAIIESENAIIVSAYRCYEEENDHQIIPLVEIQAVTTPPIQIVNARLFEPPIPINLRRFFF